MSNTSYNYHNNAYYNFTNNTNQSSLCDSTFSSSSSNESYKEYKQNNLVIYEKKKVTFNRKVHIIRIESYKEYNKVKNNTNIYIWNYLILFVKRVYYIQYVITILYIITVELCLFLTIMFMGNYII